jgi:hypothetical protein
MNLDITSLDLGFDVSLTISTADSKRAAMFLQIEGNLPPGAFLGTQQPTSNPAYDSRCLSPSANNAVNRSLTWLPPPNYGGNISTICFSVTDECGGCTCAGGRNTTVQCVVFKVVKCKYSVGNEHQVMKNVGLHHRCCSQVARGKL